MGIFTVSRYKIMRKFALMKKVLTIALTLFLLLNLTGYSVYAHYCEEDLTETSLLLSIDESCCPDELPASSCCNDEQKLIIIKDFFVRSTLQEHTHHIAVLPVLYINDFNNQTVFSLECKRVVYQNNSLIIDPPDLNILYSTFLI